MPSAYTGNCSYPANGVSEAVALIRQESIDTVIEASDMLELVAPYTTLKKVGGGYMGRCPFHSEKDPSFSIDTVKKVYYCFSCGAKGNVVNFVMEKEGLDFPDAIKSMAERYGVKLQYEESSPEEEERRRRRERSYSLLDQAASYYARVLRESAAAAAAREYLAERGFKTEVIDEFRLGFSPAGGRDLLTKAAAKGYSEDELLAAGLLRERDGRRYDYFRGRLMFPFTDHRGRVLGFGARVLGDGKPKYLNSPDSDVYHKKYLLFGLGNARQASTREDRVYIVEGYTDVLALHQVGIANVVASMGTALTESQLKEVSRYTKNVYLALDADAAGRQAMLRALDVSKKLDLTIRLVQMPGGSDPADLVLAEGGAERFRELAAEALALLEYQVHETLASADLDTADGKFRALEALKPILAGAVNAVERDEQSRIIADRLRLSPENMAYLLKPAAKVEGTVGEGGTQRRVLSQEEIAERSFLSICLANPGEAGRYLQDMTEAHFTTEPNRSAFHWIKGKLGGTGNGTVIDASSMAAAGGGVESILPELLIRSETEANSPEALPELFMKLNVAELSRRIENLKSRLNSEEEPADFHELARLEERRRRIIEHLHSTHQGSI